MGKTKLSVAVTGEIGSGKTYACEYMLELNPEWSYISADGIYKREVFPKVEDQLIRAFGTSNNREITEIILESKEKLQELNKITHPLIKKGIEDFIRENQGIVLAEIPLLFDSSEWYKNFDKTVYVKCEYNTKIKRSLNRPRNSFSEKQIRKFIEIQTEKVSPLEKETLADYTIKNNGSLAEFQSELEKLCTDLKRDLRKKSILGVKG